MLRTLARSCAVLALALTPVATFAQDTGQRPAPRAQAPSKAVRPGISLPGQPVNVRVEITITDQQPGSGPVQKTVALVLADRTQGMVRSEVNQTDIGSVPLNVDAQVSVVDTDHVLTRIALDYNLPGKAALGQGPRPAPNEPSPPSAFTRKSEVKEQIATLLQSGRPIVISESADPLTDRKVKVEVKATILK